MAQASNNHRAGAVFKALDMPSRMPPNARLWLALASMNCDEQGRTGYTLDGYSLATGDSLQSAAAGITWLLEAGLICHATGEDGNDVYQLTHYDAWHKDEALIGGYGPDRGLKRDGLPPAYGRTVDQVITPNGGNLDFEAKPWADLEINAS